MEKRDKILKYKEYNSIRLLKHLNIDVDYSKLRHMDVLSLITFKVQGIINEFFKEPIRARIINSINYKKYYKLIVQDIETNLFEIIGIVKKLNLTIKDEAFF